jgi:hypothetical protein
VVDYCSEIGWQVRIRHITSHQAETELAMLLNQIDNVSLNENPDKRLIKFGAGKHFSVKGCYYYALDFGGTTCLGNDEIWTSLAPKKCKMFAWLALHNCLSTKERLARK